MADLTYPNTLQGTLQSQLLTSPKTPGHALWDTLSTTQRLPKRECSETSSLRSLRWDVKAESDVNGKVGRKAYSVGVSVLRSLDRETTAPVETQYPKLLNHYHLI